MTGSPPGSPPSAAAASGAGWMRTPERSSAWALRLMTHLAVWVGRPVVRLLLPPIALYFLLAAPALRRRSRRYLGRALGRPARWLHVWRHLHTFAATLLDRVYLLRGEAARFDFHVQGHEALAAAYGQGRGAFLLGAHLGSFEAIRAVGQAHGAPPIAFVMYPDNAQKVNQALDAIAPQAERPTVIALGRMEAMLAVRDWLDAGGLAGMLGDRTLDNASERATVRHLPFLGRPAPFSDGPFRLAALLGRPVFFMVALYRGGWRYDVRFLPLADFSGARLGPAEREQRIEAAVRTFVATLESLCREAPHNWFNFHDFWQEDDA